jgi:hypothetical protein
MVKPSISQETTISREERGREWPYVSENI